MMQNKIQKAFGQICADDALKDTTKKAVLEKAYGKQVRKPFATKRIYSYGLLASFTLCCIIFKHNGAKDILQEYPLKYVLRICVFF